MSGFQTPSDGMHRNPAWLHIECVPGTLLTHVPETGFLIFGPKFETDGTLAADLGSARRELSLGVADDSVVVVTVMSSTDAGKAVVEIADRFMLPHTLNSSEVARKLGTTVTQVRAHCSRGEFAGFKQGRLWRYPSWQFTDEGVLPNLGVVFWVLPKAHPLTVHVLMTTRNEKLRAGRLARSPREWLLDGENIETLLHSLQQLSEHSP